MLSSCQVKETKPNLLIDRSSISLAEIKFDSTYRLSYKITNSGKGVLNIDTVTASCGCSVPIINKKNLNPGESTVLIVEYKPVDTGYFDKKVIIKSNTDSSFTVVSFSGRAVK